MRRRQNSIDMSVNRAGAALEEEEMDLPRICGYIGDCCSFQLRRRARAKAYKERAETKEQNDGTGSHRNVGAWRRR